MGGFTDSPKAPPPPPPPPPPTPMPVADDKALMDAKKRQLDRMKARSGRDATVLSQNDGGTLGG